MKSALSAISVAALAWFLPPAVADAPALPGRLPIPTREVEQFGDSRDQVALSAVVSKSEIAPGDDVVVAIIFDINPGWHIHTHDPDVPEELGDADLYVSTEIYIDVTGSSDIKVDRGFIQWPQKHIAKVAFEGTPVDYAVYEGRAIAYLPITTSIASKPGEINLHIRPVFQACDDSTCLRQTPGPGQKGWEEYGINVGFKIVPIEEKTTSTAENTELFRNFDQDIFRKIHSGEAPRQDAKIGAFGWDFDIDTRGWGLLLLLLIAAIGGFLLNLTPCVLPVIPLKIMALSSGSEHRSRTLFLGICMTLGIIFFWLLLGSLVTIFGAITATNQLFQYPAFTITVGVIIAVMAVGMCGLFTIRLPSKLYMVKTSHDTIHGSFLFGIMTAILSTPCTAPFMGGAMTWAIKQTAGVTLIVFAAIGIGMALPYLVLSAFPKLTERMPRAGAASELIKQLMGLLMLAAAAFFIGVGLSGMLVQPPEPPSRMYLWIVAGIVMASGGWLAWRTFQITSSRPRRTIFGGLGGLLFALGIYGGIELTDKGPIDWVYYQPDRLTAALEDGDVVVLEFTAEWCINCKALEKTVLASPRVVKLFDDGDAVPMKIDLTGNNEAGRELQSDIGWVGIPLLVVLAPDGTETFRGDFYTVDQVVKAVEKARQSR